MDINFYKQERPSSPASSCSSLEVLSINPASTSRAIRRATRDKPGSRRRNRSHPDVDVDLTSEDSTPPLIIDLCIEDSPAHCNEAHTASEDLPVQVIHDDNNDAGSEASDTPTIIIINEKPAPEKDNPVPATEAPSEYSLMPPPSEGFEPRPLSDAASDMSRLSVTTAPPRSPFNLSHQTMLDVHSELTKMANGDLVQFMAHLLSCTELHKVMAYQRDVMNNEEATPRFTVPRRPVHSVRRPTVVQSSQISPCDLKLKLKIKTSEIGHNPYDNPTPGPSNARVPGQGLSATSVPPKNWYTKKWVAGKQLPSSDAISTPQSNSSLIDGNDSPKPDPSTSSPGPALTSSYHQDESYKKKWIARKQMLHSDTTTAPSSSGASSTTGRMIPEQEQVIQPEAMTTHADENSPKPGPSTSSVFESMSPGPSQFMASPGPLMPSPYHQGKSYTKKWIARKQMLHSDTATTTAPSISGASSIPSSAGRMHPDPIAGSSTPRVSSGVSPRPPPASPSHPNWYTKKWVVGKDSDVESSAAGSVLGRKRQWGDLEDEEEKWN